MSKMSLASSTKPGWACSAWRGGVSYSILWWCRGHSQGNQSQTLLHSVRHATKDNNRIKTWFHSFVLHICAVLYHLSRSLREVAQCPPMKIFQVVNRQSHVWLAQWQSLLLQQVSPDNLWRSLPTNISKILQNIEPKISPFSPFPQGKIHTECSEEVKPAKVISLQTVSSSRWWSLRWGSFITSLTRIRYACGISNLWEVIRAGFCCCL